MRVAFQEVRTIAHELEVPELCPACGTNLHEGRLVCEQLEYSEQIATVSAGEIVDWGGPKASPEYITNGWRCLDCQYVLARG